MADPIAADSWDCGMPLKFQDNGDGQFYEVLYADDATAVVVSTSHDLGCPMRFHDNGDGSFSRVVSLTGDTATFSREAGLPFSVKSHTGGTFAYTMVKTGTYIKEMSHDLGVYLTYVVTSGEYAELVYVDDGSPGTLEMSRELGIRIKLHDNGDGSFSRVVTGI